ncbi:shikimate kinase [Flavobacterium psychrophilum]|uniref:shikimate kinase n=1 Tax=Flavobacterium psychrophilum TaxID=96345 RepID=UPI000B7C3C95|nr:shikimate kinase [Flavobacterium psychrophilum]ELI6454733.1 shikimate kinase [Flavobacterium psychrophilum]ELY1980062.1 shikimate kinase [Flavobacterium psychrophilum]MBF2092253.1 shikimate kinase [Flavobacterium psychrophilum]QRE62040.1 shikimate kinase [Flavobacterium psychrophilum]QRE64229.1 shikimate kinase [Flavobacterium psychrophilum]
MKKIVLVGYMASGKTEIGKLLSKKVNLPFLDIDYLIEESLSKTVNEIFEEKGEVFFRKKEHEVFKNKINSKQSFILSLGGGTPCYAENHLFLQKDDVISIYLKGSVATLVDRLKMNKDKRPLLKNLANDELAEFVAKHLFDRNFYYSHCKYTIIIDDKSPFDIVEEIYKILF